MSGIPAFDKAVRKAYEWLDELDDELGWGDRQKAYVALRAGLHALRDRLPVDEAADVAAQLPLLVRGIFFEGWNPSSTPRKVRHKAEFLQPIGNALAWEQTADAEQAARAVFRLLARHLTAGELTDVLALLPGELRQLFPAEVAH